jgi:hypothetical protein
MKRVYVLASSSILVVAMASVLSACVGEEMLEPTDTADLAVDEYDIEWGVAEEEQMMSGGGASASSVSCSDICSGVGVVACLPFGGWVGSAACGFASIPICNEACEDRRPVRISEQRARHCLLSELPEGSAVKHIGYRDTMLLFDVKNVHTQDGHVHSGKAAVTKTYAGEKKIILSWRIGEHHVRPLTKSNCRAIGSASKAKASANQAEPIWRYLNRGNADHFYTLDRNDPVYAAFGYAFEGSEGRMFRHQEPASVAVYRYWNPNTADHFFTTDWDEGENATAALGYVYEGVTGYLFEGPHDGTVPLHRYWSAAAGDHYYTLQYMPDGVCFGYCYSYEGPLGYVYP